MSMKDFKQPFIGLEHANLKQTNNTETKHQTNKTMSQ